MREHARAKIVDYLAIDNYGPAAEWKPKDPDRFIFQMLIYVAVEGEQIHGEYRREYNVTVCSPGWLSAFHGMEVLVGKRYIIADRFDWPKIKHAIEIFVEKYCVGTDAAEVSDKLRQLGFRDDESEVRTEREEKEVVDVLDKFRRIGPEYFENQRPNEEP